MDILKPFFCLAWSFVPVGVHPADCCEVQLLSSWTGWKLHTCRGSITALYLNLWYNNLCSSYSAAHFKNMLFFQLPERRTKCMNSILQNVSEEQEILIYSFHCSCIFLPLILLPSPDFHPLCPPSLSMLLLKLSKKWGQYIVTRYQPSGWYHSYILHRRLTLMNWPYQITAHLWVQLGKREGKECKG